MKQQQQLQQLLTMEIETKKIYFNMKMMWNVTSAAKENY